MALNIPGLGKTYNTPGFNRPNPGIITRREENNAPVPRIPTPVSEPKPRVPTPVEDEVYLGGNKYFDERTGKYVFRTQNSKDIKLAGKYMDSF